MKVFVEQDECISCSACLHICPEVFRWSEMGKAEVYVDEIKEEFQEAVADALDSCPTEAIKEK